jgi:YcxB-like protein
VVTVRFTFSEAENRRAMLYITLRSRAAAGMLALGLGLLAVGLSGARTAVIVIGAAELVYWLVLVAVMPLLGARRMTARASEQTLSFSDDGVSAANADGEGSFEWRHWTRWMQTGDLYVLKGARRAFTFIPRRAFASPAAESEFRELLGRHIGSRKPQSGSFGGPARGRT